MSEVDRLEDIEDRKVQIECQLIFDKGVKSVQDKIKGKMKELEEMPENQYIHLHYIKKMLRELLASGQESDQEGGQEE